MESLLLVDEGSVPARQAARSKVTTELVTKRHTMIDHVGKAAWGNRSYNTKETDNYRPLPKKFVLMWAWPRNECCDSDEAINMNLRILGKLLCVLDEEWSGIVKLVFLTLDCFHGAERYASSHASIPKETRDTKVKSIRNNLRSSADLLEYIEQTALATLRQQVKSSWFSGLLAEIEASAFKVESLMRQQVEESSLVAMSSAHPFHPVSHTIRQIVSSICWWIEQVKKHETFRFEDRVLSKEAVEDVERKLSHLCRSLGRTRREKLVDEESQIAAGHLIIVSRGMTSLEQDPSALDENQ